MNSEAVIEISQVHKYYGEGHARLHVLKGIDLNVRRGEFVAVRGASGSGKSTLLNILGCLDRASSGHYVLEGQDVSKLDDNALSTIRNRRLGFIFQSFHLIPQLNVLENVQVPLLYGDQPTEQRRARCQELLELVGLGERLDHLPSMLSGGECQRVAIARSLVNDPSLLLADEPTGNLDTRTGEEVLSLVAGLSEQGRTIIMITHDADIASHAHRQVVISDGCLTEEGEAA